MSVFQVKDWDTHFENNRSRTREKCSFVCVPNKQHGMGFSRIMAEPDGAMIYGIWHLILGACSQQTKRDGWLTSDGHQTGTAWTPEDLALKFRRPEIEVVMALEVLCSEKVGWMSARRVPAECPSGDLEGKGREEKEGKGMERPPAQTNGELPTEKEAVDMTMTAGIPEDFTRFVFSDWSVREGKDAAGNSVKFLPYVTKRWSRERGEWQSGNHKGKKTKPSDRPVGGNF